MNANVPVPPQAPDHRKRNIGIAVAVLVALIVCCCVLVVAAMVANSQLHLLDRLTGGYDPLAAVMPADASVFVSANLLNIRSDKMNKIVAAFAAEIEDLQVKDVSSGIEELDKSLEREFNMTISKDVLPWIGQYAGLGLTDLTLDRSGSPKEAKWLLAVEVRDQKAADAFLAKLNRAIADSSGDEFKQTKHKGVTIYELDTTSESERVAFARYGGLVLFAPDAASIQKAIDLQRKDSLAGQGAYADLINQLPRERALVAYVSGSQLEELLTSLSSAGGMGLGAVSPAAQLAGWRASAMSLSVVEAGLQLDTFVSYDLAQLADDQKRMLTLAGAKPKAADLFPENTLLFVTGQRPDLIWKAYREALDKASGTTDFQESLDMFEKQYGVNPDKGLFPYLDGELAIGAMPSSKGYLATSGQVPLGLVALFETSKPSALQDTLTGFTGNLKKQKMPISESSSGGMVMYEYQDPYSKSTMIAYGLNKNYLFLGSDASIVKDVFAGSKPLSKSERYQQINKALPSGMTLAAYLDVEKLLETVREGLPASGVESFDEGAKYLKPLKFVAMGNSPFKGEVARNTLLVFIATK